MKSFRDWNLSCRINAVLLLVMLAIGVGGGLFLHREANRFLSGEIARTAEAAVTAAAERINGNFPIIEAAAQEMTFSLELMKPGEATQLELLEKTLLSLRREVPALCGISISRAAGGAAATPPVMLYAWIDRDGKLRTARFGQDEYPWLDSDWFTVPRLLGRAVWTEPYRDAYTGILMSTRSQPLRNADGSFSGVVGFDLSLEGLNAEVVRADAYGYGQEFLISRFGRFVAFPEDPARTRQLNDEAATLSHSTIFSYADLLRERAFNPEDASEQLRRLGRAMQAGENGALRGRVFNREAGAERIFYAPLKNPGWSLGVAYPEVRLFAPLRDLTARLIPAAVVLLLAALLAAWIFVRRATRPLAELTDAAQAIGEGKFNTPLPVAGGRDQVGQLTAAFRGMQQALGAYIEEFKSSTEARERLEKELEIARRIQQGILPPVPSSSRCGFSFFAELRAARRVGGDLYDFFRLDDDRCCFIIGDVAGEGVPAALQMAVIQTLQRGEAGKSADPGAIVGAINEFLSSGGETRPAVSYLLGILDTSTGEIRYTNAGHPAPCVRRSGGALELLTAKHGPEVGTVSGASYGSGRVKLEKGDTLLLYTDGVTGTLDASGAAFGSDALLRVTAYRPESSPAELGTEILNALDRFSGGREQPDDLALLILRFDGYEEKGVSSDV